MSRRTEHDEVGFDLVRDRLDRGRRLRASRDDLDGHRRRHRSSRAIDRVVIVRANPCAREHEPAAKLRREICGDSDKLHVRGIARDGGHNGGWIGEPGLALRRNEDDGAGGVPQRTPRGVPA